MTKEIDIIECIESIKESADEMEGEAHLGEWFTVLELVDDIQNCLEDIKRQALINVDNGDEEGEESYD